MSTQTARNAGIAELAESMGVSYADLNCMATSAVLSMQKDKVNADEVPEEMRVDFALAYAEEAVRKFEQFRIAHHEPIARKTFSRTVHALVGAA